MKRIVLIGYRATGKTTLAQKLAEVTRLPLFSTDAMIEKSNGETIEQIVRVHGWNAFRFLESQVIANLPISEACIIDCGGGVVENNRNMEYLSDNAIVVWVDAELKDILHRMQNSDDSRPLLSEKDFEKDVLENYARRKPLYEKFSHIYVNTSRETEEQIIEKIINFWS